MRVEAAFVILSGCFATAAAKVRITLENEIYEARNKKCQLLLLIEIVAFPFRHIINSLALIIFLLLLFGFSSALLSFESRLGFLGVASSGAEVLRAVNAHG